MIKWALVALSLLLLSVSVMAQPPPPPPPPSSLPHAFYGTILIGGNPSPSGVLVGAFIDGTQRGNVTTARAGEYGTHGPFDTTRLLVKGNSSDEGKAITFFVEGYEADQTSTWTNGGVTNLNLTLHGFCGDTYCSGGETCSSCSEDCGTCPAAGGAGGGGTAACIPLWSCTGWSDCTDGKQTRECTDARKCGTDENKPEESKACEIPAEEEPKVCVAGLRVCAGDDLMECTGKAWQKIQTCEFGCSDGECEPKPSKEVTGGILMPQEINPLALYSAAVLITVIVIIGVVFWTRKP